MSCHGPFATTSNHDHFAICDSYRDLPVKRIQMGVIEGPRCLVNILYSVREAFGCF